MSITPNLCCDETEPRSIHSPDSIIIIILFKYKETEVSKISGFFFFFLIVTIEDSGLDGEHM